MNNLTLSFPSTPDTPSSNESDLWNLNRPPTLTAKDIIVISISGSSSSGKTSLSLLLSEILRIGLKDFVTGPNQQAIIHQDKYFLPKDKSTAYITFRPTKKDEEFVRRSVGKGIWDRGEMKPPAASHHLRSLKEGGKDSDSEEFVLVEHDSDNESESNFTSESTYSFEDPQNTNAAPSLIRTIDSDTWTSLNLSEFMHDISLLHDKQNRGIEFRSSLIKNSEVEALIRNNAFLTNWKNSDISRGLVTKVREWASIICLVYRKPLPTLALVEGFLLYAQPLPPPPPAPNEFGRHQTETETEMGYIKHEISPKLDIKLFIPISKAQAFERRFAREVYIDEKFGGKRVPGQMWKTEGYFEDVVWGNYCREMGWLFDANADDGRESKEAKERGVRVLGETDADMGVVLEWAVGVILGELERRIHG